MTILLDLLTSLAAKGEPCPTNTVLATLLNRNRSYVSRHLAIFIADGTISSRGNGQNRIITITATGLSTTRIRRTAQPQRRFPQQPPPCVVCGDPVTLKSNKFARSCDKPSCRSSIRYFTYGSTTNQIPWPTVGEPIETSFHEHNLTFRRDIRRGAGRPLNTSYGVSDAYVRGSE